MKRWDVVSEPDNEYEIQEWDEGTLLLYDDLFPASPDGTRHPTKQELDDCRLEPACDHVRALLERLRDVAPED